jgi:hypothetical protein
VVKLCEVSEIGNQAQGDFGRSGLGVGASRMQQQVCPHSGQVQDNKQEGISIGDECVCRSSAYSGVSHILQK